MPDHMVEADSTAKLGNVTGDLRVGRKATIMAESGRRVTVSGTAYFEGPVTIGCDFECGKMRVEGTGFGPSGNVVVRGNLLAHGDVEIDASAEVHGTVTAERVDVGGHLESTGVTSKVVRVGGHMQTKGNLRADDVDVGGHMAVTESVDISNLRVGGHAEIAGGTIRGDIKVRGHFRTSGKLSYGTVQVYGHLTLPPGSSGESLTASGRVEFEGDALCRVLEVNGVAKARGDLKVSSLKVNGRLDVNGSLNVTEKFEVLGSAESKGQIKCGDLAVGGRLMADSVASSGRAEVGGQVWTSRGLKAKEVVVGAGSRVNGPIVGESVEIGKGVVFGGFWATMSTLHTLGHPTRVDDVYGKNVRVERYSQAKRIYGEIVHMQPGSMADEVNYSKEADISEGVHLEKPSKKVDRLLDAPF
ncbi:MAG: polymer-forming cytoskeletal protein [Nitrososphaerota archaeon]|nr:polymer-forming cytoskeletal protein [Nitrososphaerota archaeon]MDG7024883.1 polymer-forming cytoskeletal protein [Nitrososphaerota archaeon]